MLVIFLYPETDLLLTRICNLYEKENGESTNPTKMVTALIKNVYEDKFND